jgi:hypothetical protein
MERFNLQKLNNAKVMVQYQIQIPDVFVPLENLDMSEAYLKGSQKDMMFVPFSWSKSKLSK